MHVHDVRPFQHDHDFGDGRSGARMRVLTQITALTLVAMGVELAVGWWSHSLALTADGWHMGTHALALGGAALAYRLSALAGRDPRGRFSFGGWKIEVLAAYTSALALGVVALWLVVDAVSALLAPRPVAYAEAMAVAVLGLFVNAVSAWMMLRQGSTTAAHDHADGPAPSRSPAHSHAHSHPHSHAHDHNFSAAYLHVLADALTSVLAIAALAAGLWWGWAWLDPAAALLGAALIGRWSWGLLRSSARALVDATADPALAQRVRESIETDGDARLTDLHLWQVGGASWSVVLTVVADRPLPAAAYRERLQDVAELGHVTVEVHRCPGSATG